MSDRIAYRNRGTLPKTIYDFMNQILGDTIIRAMLLNGLMNDASDIVGNMTIRDAEIDRISSRQEYRQKGKSHLEFNNGCSGGQVHTWKECRNHKHKLLSPKDYVPYHITSMTVEAVEQDNLVTVQRTKFVGS